MDQPSSSRVTNRGSSCRRSLVWSPASITIQLTVAFDFPRWFKSIRSAYHNNKKNTTTSHRGMLPFSVTDTSRTMRWLKDDIEPVHCTALLSAYCFMAGFLDCVHLSVIFVWCWFQAER
ncbi:hypothetical protein PM082_023154 [Marasmius tenuissimus]|nr:hypothetical protein PM082_023154 [Marasmius tenuissimus]